MPLVMNASSKEQRTQVHGAWFTFAPGQIKEMQDDKVFFLVSNRAYQGFVSVPEKFADIDYRNTLEGKKALEDLRAQGISNRVQHLEWLKNNELKSLRKDMDKQNMKADTESEMTGESFSALTSALEELKGYKTKSKDSIKERQAQLQELQKALEGSGE